MDEECINPVGSQILAFECLKRVVTVYDGIVRSGIDPGEETFVGGSWGLAPKIYRQVEPFVVSLREWGAANVNGELREERGGGLPTPPNYYELEKSIFQYYSSLANCTNKVNTQNLFDPLNSNGFHFFVSAIIRHIERLLKFDDGDDGGGGGDDEGGNDDAWGNDDDDHDLSLPTNAMFSTKSNTNLLKIIITRVTKLHSLKRSGDRAWHDLRRSELENRYTTTILHRVMCVVNMFHEQFLTSFKREVSELRCDL